MVFTFPYAISVRQPASLLVGMVSGSFREGLLNIDYFLVFSHFEKLYQFLRDRLLLLFRLKIPFQNV